MKLRNILYICGDFTGIFFMILGAVFYRQPSGLVSVALDATRLKCT